MSNYEPGAPEWWTKQQRQEQEADKQAASEADALKQARRARFIAVARRAVKAVAVTAGVLVMVAAALLGVLAAGAGPSRGRR